MADLAGRGVQTKAEAIDQERVRKAQRRAESDKAVKERIAPQSEGEELKSRIIGNIRASGHEAAEVFLAEFSGHHWKVFKDGRIEAWWAERKSAGKEEGSLEMQHGDYVKAWAELGADPGNDIRWSSEALISAKRMAKLYAETPNGDWTAIRAIVAKLGTCAWIWHIGGIYGNTVEVLHAHAYEKREKADQKWATYVALELSKITGRELKGEPCHVPWVGISHRAVR